MSKFCSGCGDLIKPWEDPTKCVDCKGKDFHEDCKILHQIEIHDNPRVYCKECKITMSLDHVHRNGTCQECLKNVHCNGLFYGCKCECNKISLHRFPTISYGGF